MQGQQSQMPLQGQSLRPIRKFSSFFQGAVQYQCVQTCFPVVPTETQIMVELCNKICPFNPTNPECARCGQVYYMSAHPDKEVLEKKSMYTQAEALVVDPQTHAIAFKPEIVVNGLQKECCYLDKCSMVPLQQECPSVCYEPCDSACTDKCMVNPECPNECDRIRKEQFKLRYRIWLMNKLNEIKQKYRNYAALCLLKTRAGLVDELKTFYTNVHASIAPIAPLLADDSANPELVAENSQIPQSLNPATPEHQQVRMAQLQGNPLQTPLADSNRGIRGNENNFEMEPVHSEELQDEFS